MKMQRMRQAEVKVDQNGGRKRGIDPENFGPLPAALPLRRKSLTRKMWKEDNTTKSAEVEWVDRGAREGSEELSSLALGDSDHDRFGAAKESGGQMRNGSIPTLILALNR